MNIGRGENEAAPNLGGNSSGGIARVDGASFPMGGSNPLGSARGSASSDEIVACALCSGLHGLALDAWWLRLHLGAGNARRSLWFAKREDSCFPGVECSN